MKKKRVISILIMTVLLISLYAPMSYASSNKTKTMTTYSVIKQGDTVYCNYGGIYKVDLKTGKFKKVVSKSYGDLHIHKGYLYFIYGVGGEYYRSEIRRMKLSNNKVTTLIKKKGTDFDYAISKSKIYVDGGKKARKVMNLNGKNKKSSKVKVKMKYKESNVDGYYIEQKDFYNEYDDEEYEYSIVYLITPDGDIELLRGYDDGEGVEEI